MNKFEELKRNRYIKKMHSNAIAMSTRQIDLREGCLKMEYFYDQIEYIQSLEGVDIDIFEEFSSKTSFFPLSKEREVYNQEYLSKLDARLSAITDQYYDRVVQKCEELINKLQYIKTVI
ncbi:hypothetical protein HX13_09285 [Chryseobacterium sp. P1-3]|uniref:DUF2489 domain-containing protein n=1 Tax=Chryseobacterium sp. (strain P1-3) TaxID=1517683 RepID=UPI0004E61220|nr:DUF2489 domain-containing protein [Chryseobacterium sp. P1-3]KFF74366.1 hypothetical protein HX13_09285 [Chryseobacterium sp. P1-3]